MRDDIQAWLERWLPAYKNSQRSYMTIAIGCTGGQHRSVYMVEQLAERLAHSIGEIQLRHRELGLQYTLGGQPTVPLASNDYSDERQETLKCLLPIMTPLGEKEPGCQKEYSHSQTNAVYMHAQPLNWLNAANISRQKYGSTSNIRWPTPLILCHC